MQTVFITIVGPARRIDLKLPAEVPIKILLPKLLELCGPPLSPQVARSEWRLVIPGKGIALSPISSLLACGVVDGARLLLQDYASFAAMQQDQAQNRSFRPQALPPSADTGGIGVKWNLPNR